MKTQDERLQAAWKAGYKTGAKHLERAEARIAKLRKDYDDAVRLAGAAIDALPRASRNEVISAMRERVDV